MTIEKFVWINIVAVFLALCLLVTSGCQLNQDAYIPQTIQYDAELFVYFEGINTDAGVEFDLEQFQCIDGFVYDVTDTATAIGECDTTVKARFVANRTI